MFVVRNESDKKTAREATHNWKSTYAVKHLREVVENARPIDGLPLFFFLYCNFFFFFYFDNSINNLLIRFALSVFSSSRLIFRFKVGGNNYFNLCIIKYFLDVISPQNDMRDKLLKLLSDYPSIDLAAMGFPQGWQQEPLWQ